MAIFIVLTFTDGKTSCNISHSLLPLSIGLDDKSFIVKPILEVELIFILFSNQVLQNDLTINLTNYTKLIPCDIASF